MSPNTSQVFQTNNPTRWQRVKWGMRVLGVVIGLAIVVISIALWVASRELPGVPLETRAIKKVLTEDQPDYRASELGKRYRGFRKLIEDRWAKGRGTGQNNTVLDLSSSSLFSDSLGIRAAFYVAWDQQSFFSLRKNISKMNLVLPEWFFIDPKADTLFTAMDKDKRAFDLIKTSGVKVMPMLSNSYNAQFNGAALHRILNSPKKTDRLINDVLRLLKENNFAGINVDFEELQEDNNEVLTNFEKKLYNALHSNGFLVTQNVSPFNEDYDYKELAKYNDYIFLMAYDQHSESSKPGPVGSQRWIQNAVNKLATHVSPSKIVLNLAAYGYDWGHDTTTTVTYQEALAVARESDGKIEFDNDTYNLYYKYYDGDDRIHEVHFTDAATNFNTLRFATEYGLAGTAVWRLGSEDDRLWEFYNRSLTKDALKNFDFKEAFSNVESMSTPDFIGEGEVLDLMATPSDGHITTEIDTKDYLVAEQYYDKLPSSYVVRKYGKRSDKKLVLTYDDGPDPLYTRQILDTLAKYKVPAAFFVVGIEAENNIPLIKRIMREGHEIGNHTFTHPNMAEVSRKRALLEIDATRLLIECLTGRSTIMFRAPYNADSDPEKSEEMVPVALSRTRNYITIGESIDPEDWQKQEIPELNGDSIFNRVLNIYNFHLSNNDSANIILLHDAGGDRSATVEATGKIIRYFQARGYEFVTVANLLHKKPEDMMPPVEKGMGYTLLRFNYLFAEAGYMISHFLYALFLVFLVLGAIRILILGFFALQQKRKEKKARTTELPAYPPVSIIVPAYNEEVNAVSSVHNLLRCDYPDFNIIFVDDGSSDATYSKVFEAFHNHPRVRVFTKPNGGKSSALNFGIAQTDAPFVVCIDADTKLMPDAVRQLMKAFADENTGAVAGIVKVGNEVNLLTRWQSIEYTVSQNFDRRGFAWPNAITVVPGAIGGFRRKALEDAGGFTTDTLAEDCDITIRILRAGYRVANEPDAIAWTEAPESLSQFFKQRQRWTFGVMQAFWKHKDALFNTRYKGLGWVALPDILLFKYIIPFFSPIGDIIMLFGLLTENRGRIANYYLIFLLFDALIAALAFAFEKEKPWKLVWLIPQRLIYRWLMIIVLFRSYRRAIKGELQHWGVLKRTGNVKDVTFATTS
jgi:cellulose synthase/poly-beta-1,6-N-acetylglucosamine synthase-like glycosyltransferase/spore germination protein YaaH/peptidoglycan/xylan/chitin deacetylase (PgdA/CDA1 family)